MYRVLAKFALSREAGRVQNYRLAPLGPADIALIALWHGAPVAPARQEGPT